MIVAFWLAFGALWVLVLFQTLVLLGLTRIIHQGAEEGALRSGDGDLTGQQAPTFEAVDLSGLPIHSDDLLGRPAALLFVSPDCQSCAVTLAELDALKFKANGTVVVLCRSNGARCAQLAQTYGLGVPVVVDEDFALSRLFRVTGAPTAVLLRADGVIETYGRPMGPSDLEQAVAAAGWGDVGDGVDITANEAKANGGVSVHVGKEG